MIVRKRYSNTTDILEALTELLSDERKQMKNSIADIADGGDVTWEVDDLIKHQETIRVLERLRFLVQAMIAKDRSFEEVAGEIELRTAKAALEKLSFRNTINSTSNASNMRNVAELEAYGFVSALIFELD